MIEIIVGVVLLLVGILIVLFRKKPTEVNEKKES